MSEPQSEPALSLAFFDPEHELHGIARAGATLLFEGTTPTVLSEGPGLERVGHDGWRARLADRLDLSFAPRSAAVPLGPVRVRLCRVGGSVAGQRIDCLGTASETVTPPSWAELDALRTVSAIFDEGTAVLALARRPRGARGHGEELISATLLDQGEPHAVEDARLSTVYDGEGRQRSAGLELWLPGEDLPRRATGTAAAGSSLGLEALLVHAAVFRWRMEGREGAGEYNLVVRGEPPAAA